MNKDNKKPNPPQQTYSVTNCTVIGYQANEHSAAMVVAIAKALEREAAASEARAMAFTALAGAVTGGGVHMDAGIKLGGRE
jgi:hypothetical protein